MWNPPKDIFTASLPQSFILMHFFLDLLSCLGKIRATLSRKTEAITSPRIIYIRHQIVPVPTGGREPVLNPTNVLGIPFIVKSLHEFIFLPFLSFLLNTIIAVPVSEGSNSSKFQIVSLITDS